MKYLGVVALAIVILRAACADPEEELPPGEAATPTPVSATPFSAPAGTPVAREGWQTMRFLNVTISTPEGLLASPILSDSGDQWTIVLEPYPNAKSRVVIDAETGTIVQESVSTEDQTIIDSAVATIRLSPLDPKSAPWPYTGDKPPDERDGWGSITYARPDPLSGIFIGLATGDGGSSPGACSNAILVGNGRSSLSVNACTGEPSWEGARIAPEDKDAFNRFLEAIKVVP